MKTIIAALIALAVSTAWADTITGRVVGVADGDTITVLDAANQEHKIRLAGIDCPEQAQPYGQAAKQSMSDLVYDRTVTVEASKRDRYGREIGKVLVDGVDANREQLRRGLAWHYKKYAHEQDASDREDYSDAESVARAARRGLWSVPAAVAPWDWRKGVRE